MIRDDMTKLFLSISAVLIFSISACGSDNERQACFTYVALYNGCVPESERLDDIAICDTSKPNCLALDNISVPDTTKSAFGYTYYTKCSFSSQLLIRCILSEY